MPAKVKPESRARRSWSEFLSLIYSSRVSAALAAVSYSGTFAQTPGILVATPRRAAIIRPILRPHRQSRQNAKPAYEAQMSATMSSVIASLILLVLAAGSSQPPAATSHGYLVVANQKEHTALLVDPESRQEVAKFVVGVNGHEVIVSPDGRYAYVPIYGNSGVGKPGTDGSTIDVIDIRDRKLTATIDLGKPLRPHCAKFGPDGLLYVSAELDKALDVVDPASRKVIAEIPTGAIESHMFVISPDGKRAYTAIPIAKTVQRISISPDGKQVFTHDQDTPRIAVIDTAKNKIANWIPLLATVYSSSPTPDGHKLLASSPS